MRNTFSVKNFIVSAAPVFLAAIVLGLVAVFISFEISGRTIEAVNRQTISRIKESTEIILSEADALILIYNIYPHARARLEKLFASGYSDKDSLDFSYTIKAFLDSSVNSKPFLHSIYIYLENDNGYFFSSNVGLASKQNAQDIEWLSRIKDVPPEIRQWFEIRLINRFNISAFSSRVITLYIRIYSSGNSASTGVLALNIFRDYLEGFYRQYLSYPMQRLALLNEKGDLLCVAGGEVGDLKDVKTKGLSVLEKNYFVAAEEKSAYGITYLSLVPRSNLFLQARTMIIILLVSILFAVIVGGIFAYLLEMNRKNRWLAEEKYTFKAAQLSMLQSQINPHFLFNSLKNIFWKTVSLTGTPNPASRMTDLLSSILHYNLVNADRFVTVEEEIQNTRKYIELLKIRFSGAFTADWILDEDIGGEKCVKFILQPLIENSVSHGLREKERGRLEISVKREGQGIRFQVKDNGKGFTRERLGLIQYRFSLDDPPAENTGLYNLNKRLVLIYGPDAGLSISSEEGIETIIRFAIPSIPLPNQKKK
jgi:two-component system sensor histidine kinase YesM